MFIKHLIILRQFQYSNNQVRYYVPKVYQLASVTSFLTSNPEIFKLLMKNLCLKSKFYQRKNRPLCHAIVVYNLRQCYICACPLKRKTYCYEIEKNCAFFATYQNEFMKILLEYPSLRVTTTITRSVKRRYSFLCFQFHKTIFATVPTI